MFTQTHFLIGAAVFARTGARAVALAGLTGAVLPDADVWAMFAIERLDGASSCEIFHYRYWEQPWTTVQMVLNSIPLYLTLLGLGLALANLARGWPRITGLLLTVFAASALLHVGADFLLHHEDARAQWMPFSGRVFRSPVSYWNPDHYGNLFMPFEIALGLSLAVMIGRRFRLRWVWAGLCLLSLIYAGTVAAGQLSAGQHPRGPGSCAVIAAQKAAARAQVSANSATSDKWENSMRASHVSTDQWTLGKWALWGLLALICLLYGMFALSAGLGLAETGKVRSLPVAFAVHALAGGVVLIAGIAQFNSALRRRMMPAHRWVGRTYVICALVASIAAVANATFFDVSRAAQLSFAVLGATWFATTAFGWRMIRARDVARHQEWMIRSFSLSMFFVTFSIWVPLLAGSGIGGGYAAAVTLSWVLNLIAAEIWIRRRRGQSPDIARLQ